MKLPKKMVVSTLIPAVMLIGAVGYFAMNKETEPPLEQSVAVTEANLSADDKQKILDAVMVQDVTIPAGTELDVDFTSITGNKVNGTFNYSNGIKGTYTAEMKNEKWLVVDYKKQ